MSAPAPLPGRSRADRAPAAAAVLALASLVALVALAAAAGHGQLAALLVVFAAGGLSMFAAALPSLLALPAMAAGVALVALVRWGLHAQRLAALSVRSLAIGAAALGLEAALAGALLGLLAWGGSRIGRVANSRRVPRAITSVAVVAAILALVPAAFRPLSRHWWYTGQLAGIVQLFAGLGEDARWILTGVGTQGALRLAPNIMIVLAGSMLAAFTARTGLAAAIVRTAAELGGDRPRVLAGLLLVVTAALFTTMGGLGAIVMVGMVVLPLLLSLETDPASAAAVMLMGVSLGGVLNPANWVLYLEVFHVPRSVVAGFCLPMCAWMVVVVLAFLWRELPAAPAAAAPAPIAVDCGDEPLERPALARFSTVVGLLVRPQSSGLRPAMLALPLVPLALILGAGVDEVPAFLLTLVLGALLFAGPRRRDLLAASILEGARSAVPAVAILMGLGMLLKALSLPVFTPGGGPGTAAVPALMAGPVRWIVPSTDAGYVLFFTLAAPLALYRGPLNIYGLGLGLGEVLRATGTLPASRIMAMLIAVGQVQGICDPTNTHNIWIAGFVRVSTRRILARTLPYALAMAAGGLAIAVALNV